MCACDQGQECARHRAEAERHEDEEQRELDHLDAVQAFAHGESMYDPDLGPTVADF